eukprot:TRINITY_DN5070_c0_g1_i1.p2 TRINITY_DN5070_c0_g1~~TRINITY_DN5070_c0_g1_i1.p2  ORF type:complete len:194 (+),score=85.49 TRINITY_DN5070_c0_g1_i1:43-582(+)
MSAPTEISPLGAGASFLIGCLSTLVFMRLWSTGSHTRTVGGDSDDEDDHDSASGRFEDSIVPREHKMVLVVRTDLKMGKGKMCAQCGHATLGAYQRAQRHTPGAVRSWSRFGQAKIAVKVQSEDALLAVQVAAADAGLVHYVVQDAGRTQIEAGSLTVLAIGPAPIAAVDAITRHLKLL